MSQPTVALDPDGVVRVCTGQSQQFMCTSGAVAWTISGFGNGISDATLYSAFDYAPNNFRVTTRDNSAASNPSTLTFMMLGYPDDNARVTCTDNTRSSMITSTIRIGESAFRNVENGSVHLQLPLTQAVLMEPLLLVKGIMPNTINCQ